MDSDSEAGVVFYNQLTDSEDDDDARGVLQEDLPSDHSGNAMPQSVPQEYFQSHRISSADSETPRATTSLLSSMTEPTQGIHLPTVDDQARISNCKHARADRKPDFQPIGRVTKEHRHRCGDSEHFLPDFEDAWMNQCPCDLEEELECFDVHMNCDGDDEDDDDDDTDSLSSFDTFDHLNTTLSRNVKPPVGTLNTLPGDMSCLPFTDPSQACAVRPQLDTSFPEIYHHKSRETQSRRELSITSSSNSSYDSLHGTNLTLLGDKLSSRQRDYNIPQFNASQLYGTKDYIDQMFPIDVQSSNVTGSANIADVWLEGWTCGDVIVCPNMFFGRSVVDSYKPETSNGDKGRETNDIKPRVPRMFHRRAKSGAHRPAWSMTDAAFISSPLFMLFDMVKSSGLDIAAVIENAEYFGLSFKMACMQCFEAKGHARLRGDRERGTLVSEGRCLDCGGQVLTLASIGKMIRKLQQVMREKDFVVHDVYPDGNCVFGTVIDQLRTRGDFRYTVHSLRAAVVEYLREHPNAEDGTPMEMFLSDESWEEYLQRMSEDGQWGDHMVLDALTNVLETEIHIYGGETETVLKPRSQDGESSQSKPASPPGAAADPTKLPIPMKNLNAAVKEETPAQAIHLGYFSESHYISLRQRLWKENIVQMRLDEMCDWIQGGHVSRNPSKSMIFPVDQLDFFLKHTILLEYIHSNMAAWADTVTEIEGDGFNLIPVGPIMCKMTLDHRSCSESVLPDIEILFSSGDHQAASKVPMLPVLRTPKDTVVINSHVAGQSSNLIAEKISHSSLTVHLKPVTPEIWKETVTSSETGTQYLKALDIRDLGIEVASTTVNDETLIWEQFIAFRQDWPDEGSGWLTRSRKSNFPDSMLLQTLFSQGCHVIPIVPSRGLKYIVDCHVTDNMLENRITWCLTFALVEKQLAEHFTDDQRQCFLIFSAMLDFLTQSDNQIPFAIEKTVFFYACENVEKPMWKDNPGKCLMMMLKKLAEGLQLAHIPHYFLKAQNLLQDIPAPTVQYWATVANCLLTEPVVPLYFVLDSLNITATELGALLDDMIDHIFWFNYNHCSKHLLDGACISSGGTLVQNLIYQGEFKYAMKALESMQDLFTRIKKQPVPYDKVIVMLLYDMSFGYAWCMGFFVDLKLGTTVSADLTRRFNAVHISEIFGPLDEMPSTIVPCCYSIDSGDVMFPYVASQVIYEARGPRLMVQCIKYYLESYASLAGEEIVLARKNSCRRYTLKLLQKLHMILLEALEELGCPQEFRSFMPTFSTISEMLSDTNSYDNMVHAWEVLGEPDKAAQYHCPQSPREMLKTLLSTLTAQAY